MAHDLTRPMLQQAVQVGRQRGLGNVRYVQATAEELPFPDGAFDVLTCRTAGHHFRSVAAFLAEARRVVRQRGQVLLVDTVTTEDPEVDRWQNQIELLRDPSHVRDYPPSEWPRFFEGAGLAVRRTANRHRTPLSFDDWVARSGTPAGAVAELRELFERVPAGVAEALQIRKQGEEFEWAWPVLVVQAVRE